MLIGDRWMYDRGFRVVALGEDFDEFERPLPGGGVLVVRVGVTSFEVLSCSSDPDDVPCRVGGGATRAALERVLQTLT